MTSHCPKSIYDRSCTANRVVGCSSRLTQLSYFGVHSLKQGIEKKNLITSELVNGKQREYGEERIENLNGNWF